MPTEPGRKRSCKPCRERHLKCDRVNPVCSNCQKSRHLVECVYETKGFRFRPCVISSSTASDGNGGDHGNDGSSSRDNEAPDQHLSPVPSVSTGAQAVGPSPNSGGTLSENRAFLSLDISRDIPLQDSSVEASTLLCNSAGEESSATAPEAENPCTSISPSPSARPIADSTEASIFRFYLEYAGPWLDNVSPHQFFSVHVPSLTPTEPVLLSACLAYASHVLHLHGRIPSQTRDDLHDRALRQLIPLITKYRETTPTTHGLDTQLGTVHATTVLLRMTEQFLEPDEDRHHHLYGSSTLFETGRWSLLGDTLSGAAFWAYLRGSIRVSFLLERPCPFELHHLRATWRAAAQDAELSDAARTNLMTYLMAEVCTLCWGAEEIDAAKLGDLAQAVAEWKRCLPPSFQPWYTRYEEGDVFPNVCFLSSWHAVAWQFYYAAEVMLAVYSPTIQGERNAFRLTRLLEEKIVMPTRWLCGVIMSCSSIGVKINGSHLMAWSGQFVTERTEQNKILEELLSLWHEVKWPNITCCDRLKALWGSSRESWVLPSG